MNTHNIELPPLPRPQVPRIDADIDLIDIRRLAQWAERIANEHAIAAIEADRQARGEPVYLYRRKGQDAFVTCDKARYDELSGKPNLFEMRVLYTAPQLQQTPDGWREAAIAWEVCASTHRIYAKGKDPLFSTRQADYVKHANDARAMPEAAPKP